MGMVSHEPPERPPLDPYAITAAVVGPGHIQQQVQATAQALDALPMVHSLNRVDGWRNLFDHVFEAERDLRILVAAMTGPAPASVMEAQRRMGGCIHLISQLAVARLEAR